MRQSVFQMGTSVANMIAPPLVAFCILAWNWQATFIVTGGLSLAWAFPWYWSYRNPADHPALIIADRAAITAARGEDVIAKPATRKDLLQSRAFWGIAVPRFLSESAWQTFNFLISLYLVSGWHLHLRSIALWAWMPFLAADF